MEPACALFGVQMETARALSRSKFVKTTSEEMGMNTATTVKVDFVEENQDEMFDGDGLVPLVIADRDAATGPFRHATA